MPIHTPQHGRHYSTGSCKRRLLIIIHRRRRPTSFHIIIHRRRRLLIVIHRRRRCCTVTVPPARAALWHGRPPRHPASRPAPRPAARRRAPPSPPATCHTASTFGSRRPRRRVRRRTRRRSSRCRGCRRGGRRCRMAPPASISSLEVGCVNPKPLKLPSSACADAPLACTLPHVGQRCNGCRLHGGPRLLCFRAHGALLAGFRVYGCDGSRAVGVLMKLPASRMRRRRAITWGPRDAAHGNPRQVCSPTGRNPLHAL